MFTQMGPALADLGCCQPVTRDAMVSRHGGLFKQFVAPFGIGRQGQRTGTLEADRLTLLLQPFIQLSAVAGEAGKIC